MEKRAESVHLPGIGPGRESRHQVELPKHVADDAIGLTFGAQLIELRHHLIERGFDIADGALRVVLALSVKTPLTADELFSIKA